MERNSLMKQRNFFNRTRRIFCAIVAIVALVAGFGILPGAVFGQAATTASPLKIGIIGSGNIGSTLGTLWVKSGHPVQIGRASCRERVEISVVAVAATDKHLGGRLAELTLCS